MSYEWNVLIIYEDGATEHFIFAKGECPTVVEVIKLIDSELKDKVHKLVITGVSR